MICAAASVPANVAEGEGRSGQDRVCHWRVAYGSARELAVHLTLLGEAGAIDRPAAERLLSLLDEVRAMLWRMPTPVDTDTDTVTGTDTGTGRNRNRGA